MVLFYDDVKTAKLRNFEALKAEAPKHGCVEPLSVFDFIHKIFLPTAFRAGGLVVGFNLPFDLSRLAIRHEAARVSRAPRTPEQIATGAPLRGRGSVNGRRLHFPAFPIAVISHSSASTSNSRPAFFRFAKPAQQETARSRRRPGRAGSVSTRQLP